MYQQVSAMHEEELSGPTLLLVWLVAIGISFGVLLGVVMVGLAAVRWVLA